VSRAAVAAKVTFLL